MTKTGSSEYDPVAKMSGAGAHVLRLKFVDWSVEFEEVNCSNSRGT